MSLRASLIWATALSCWMRRMPSSKRSWATPTFCASRSCPCTTSIISLCSACCSRAPASICWILRLAALRSASDTPTFIARSMLLEIACTSDPAILAFKSASATSDRWRFSASSMRWRSRLAALASLMARRSMSGWAREARAASRVSPPNILLLRAWASLTTSPVRPILWATSSASSSSSGANSSSSSIARSSCWQMSCSLRFVARSTTVWCTSRSSAMVSALSSFPISSPLTLSSRSLTLLSASNRVLATSMRCGFTLTVEASSQAAFRVSITPSLGTRSWAWATSMFSACWPILRYSSSATSTARSRRISATAWILFSWPLRRTSRSTRASSANFSATTIACTSREAMATSTALLASYSRSLVAHSVSSSCATPACRASSSASLIDDK
mmetsp:Transcript_12337/g.27476  ORF Transcript_12337/g.27476 Transcript_12337/m.27476 type:complete len:390 (-) Transcript_12337:330-1499(-)